MAKIGLNDDLNPIANLRKINLEKRGSNIHHDLFAKIQKSEKISISKDSQKVSRKIPNKLPVNFWEHLLIIIV